MMGDIKSEKFFKVLNDRMKNAQLDIKSTISVNVGEMSNKAKDDKDMETGHLKKVYEVQTLWEERVKMILLIKLCYI